MVVRAGLWLVGVVVLVVVLLVIGVFLWLSMSQQSSQSEAKPRIGIGDISSIDLSHGRVYVRIINGDDKAYLVNIRVEGCVDKTYNNVPIDAMDVKDFPINIPQDKIVNGCQLKLYIIYNNEIIASKTLTVKLG